MCLQSGARFWCFWAFVRFQIVGLRFWWTTSIFSEKVWNLLWLIQILKVFCAFLFIDTKVYIFGIKLRWKIELFKISLFGVPLLNLLIIGIYFRPGASVTAKITCNKGHSFSWCSSEPLKREKGLAVKEINLMLVVYTFLAGIHFRKIQVLSSSA